MSKEVEVMEVGKVYIIKHKIQIGRDYSIFNIRLTSSFKRGGNHMADWVGLGIRAGKKGTCIIDDSIYSDYVIEIDYEYMDLMELKEDLKSIVGE